MHAIQLDFFQSEEMCEIDHLRQLVMKLENSNTRVRKSLYARNNEIEKLARDLEIRLNIIERNICTN